MVFDYIIHNRNASAAKIKDIHRLNITEYTGPILATFFSIQHSEKPQFREGNLMFTGRNKPITENFR